MARRCIICQCPRNLRFHELPSEHTLREKWLALVPAAEQLDLSKNPKVCELHFFPSNYEPDAKKRRLKKDVVPSVIPREELDALYTSMQEAATALKELDSQKLVDSSELSVNEISMHEISVHEVTVNASKEIQEKPSGKKRVKSQPQQVGVEVQAAKAKTAKVLRKLEILKAQLEHFKEENKEKTLKIKSLCSELKELKTISHRQASEIRSKDKSLRQVQLKAIRLSELSERTNEKDLGIANRKEKKNDKEKEEHLKKIRSLKEQVEILSTERKEMEKICYYKNIEEMILNMDNNRKAAFILDQIKLYNMKVPRYADSTLQECIIWEDTDPRGYQFVRESELLTLPSQHTMKKHLGPMNSEIDLNHSSNIQSTESCISTSEARTVVIPSVAK